MTIQVIAHPKSKQVKIECKDNVYHIYTTKIPEKGKANAAIIDLISEHFRLPKSKIELTSGEKSKRKTFKLYMED